MKMICNAYSERYILIHRHQCKHLCKKISNTKMDGTSYILSKPGGISNTMNRPGRHESLGVEERGEWGRLLDMGRPGGMQEGGQNIGGRTRC
jgi:hypothetical protein